MDNDIDHAMQYMALTDAMGYTDTDGEFGVSPEEFAAGLRKDAERYRKMLANLEKLVLRTKKGSRLTLNADKRGERVARLGTDAVLDSLGAA